MSDLIKREDLFELMMRHKPIDNGDGSKERYAYIEWLGIYNAIRELPTADRPQGEWIDAEIPLESGGSMPIQACNLCKTFYPLAYTGGGHRFCPNCGAKMKGA